VINAGRLDRRVKLQRLTESQSESGAVEYTPRLIATVWAEKVPEGGSEAFREAFREEQLQGWSRVTWRIRWVQDDFDLSEPTVKWRLVEGTRIYDILAVQEIGRRWGWELVTRARAEDQRT
jgi:head-tail adaptor